VYSEFFGGNRLKEMTWREYLGAGIPCGLATSLDVGLSNLSLVTISITFYTMVKSATPIFVLGWAFLFGIERITGSLVLVVMIIAAGEFLTVLGEVDFDTRGFVLCLCASVISGARWTVVQLKLQGMQPPLKTAIATMRLLSPSMFISMIVISLAIEEPWLKLGAGTPYFASFEQGLHTVGLCIGGALLAICMIICELYLIMNSSAIVLMIGGVIKEMTTILVGVNFFGDPLNAINVAGISVVFLGVVFYKVNFHMGKLEEKDAESETQNGATEYQKVNIDPEKESGAGYPISEMNESDTLTILEEDELDFGGAEYASNETHDVLLQEGIDRMRANIETGISDYEFLDEEFMDNEVR